LSLGDWVKLSGGESRELVQHEEDEQDADFVGRFLYCYSSV